MNDPTLAMPTAPTLPDAGNDPSMPVLKMSRPKSLPTGVSSNVKQHVVIVCDHSTSMTGDKIAEANLARDALIRELADPANKDGFRCTVVEFNCSASRVAFGEPAGSLHLAPMVASGGTNFVAALTEALNAIREFKARPNDEGYHYMRPHVLKLSDGQAGIDDALLAELHEEADVTAIAYGADADQDTLRRIASDGKVHVVGTNGGELRKFLEQVGRTLSQGVQNTGK